MPKSDRLGVLISLVLLGLILSALVPLPTQEVALVVLGSELTLRFTGTAQLALLLAGLVAAGVEGIMRAHPRLPSRSLFYTMTFWPLPALITVLSLILLDDLSTRILQMGFIGLAAAVLGLVIVLQYRDLSQSSQPEQADRLLLNVITYVTALWLLSAVFGARLRSLLSATGVMLVSGMLALGLLRSSENLRRTWLYASIVGMLMGELTWAMNYGIIDTRTGSGFLLLAYYALTGLSQQHIWGRLQRRVVIEFIAVAGLGLVVLLALGRSI